MENLYSGDETLRHLAMETPPDEVEAEDEDEELETESLDDDEDEDEDDAE